MDLTSLILHLHTEEGEEILAKLKKKNKEIIINTKCGTNRNFQRSFKKKRSH